MSTINNGYNLFNRGARVYSDTQTQTQPTATQATQAQQPAQATKLASTNAAVAPTQAEKVTISDSGRAAIAQNKDSFVNAIMKAGYSKEAAEARFNGLQSQRNNDATVQTTPATTSTVATPATAATSLTQPVGDTSKTNNASANATSSQPENKALDRFVNGFTKSGYTKDQAINAYNMYAALANQQGVRT